MTDLVKYWDKDSQQEYSLADLREAKPNMSIPESADLSSFGIYPIQEVPAPVFDKDVETVISSVFEDEGVFIRGWKVIPLPQNQIDDNVKIRNKSTVELLMTNVQMHLDRTAQVKGYDNILTACSYTQSTNERYAEESIKFVKLRDRTWETLEDILEDIETGKRSLLVPFAEISDELPKYGEV